MKRYVAWLLLASTSILASSCIQHVPKAKTGADLVNDLMEQTVALDKFMAPDGVDEDGDLTWKLVDPDDVKDVPDARLVPYCAAEWISSNMMLTAFHCVEDEGEATEDKNMRLLLHRHRDPTGQLIYYSRHGEVSQGHDRNLESVHPARVYAVDMDEDLALVRTDPNTLDPQDDPHPVVHLARTLPRPGDDVHIIGHVENTWWTYTHGYVGQLRPYLKKWDDDNHIDVIQVNAPVWHGDSGGGAYNMNGELVGVSSWMYIRAPSIAFYIDAPTCRAFLRRNGINL